MSFAAQIFAKLKFAQWKYVCGYIRNRILYYVDRASRYNSC